MRSASGTAVTAGLAVAAAVVAAVVAPAAGLRTYNASARLDDTATLSWTLTPTAVRFGLVVTDAALFGGNASAAAAWVGLGIGEPTSGSMLGADIVTAEFTGPAACALVNRHVPSVAVPLGSSTGGDAIFPEPDAPCAAESWTLAACAVDAAAGTVTLEVDRPLAAANAAQDRPVVAGRNVLMYAYGDGFGYHGGRRHGTEVDLTQTGGRAVAAGGLAESGLLPTDATASQLMTVPPYEISANRTDYGCFSFEVDLGAAGGGAGRQIVAAEAVIDTSTPAGRLVHHLVLSSCERDGGWADFAAGKSCLTEMPQCRDIVYGWAAGASPLVMPPEAGFPVSGAERTYILQVHYDNPDGLVGVVDNSSAVRLHFTDTPRPQEAGTINIGDPTVALSGQPVASDRNYTVACPAECTVQLASPLTIYSSVLHAHRTALYLFTNQYRNGTFLRTLEGAAFWSNDHQRPTLFEQADLLPGDRLEVTGRYDTAKLDAAGEEPPITWGLGTPQEMLMSFLFVYPRPVRAGAAAPNDTISYCGLVLVDDAGTPGTICTNGQEFRPDVGVLSVNPLSENGPVGWSPAFGQAPTCAVASDGAPSPSTADDDAGGACFPADATATVAGRGQVAMADLRLGDTVLSADGTYSTIYLWSHADAAAVAPFLAITTATPADAPVSGGANGTAGAPPLHTLTVSAGHLLPVAGGGASPLPASAITAGVHALVGPDGLPRPVTAVTPVTSTGLYHPHTLSGDLVIGGAVVATDRTTAVPPAAAAVGLAAARGAAAVGLGGVLSGVLAGGCPPVLRGLLPMLRRLSA